jgi:general secretion pathway protein F
VGNTTGVGIVGTEAVIYHLPVVGRVLRLDAVARWCDICVLGVQSGMTLPESLSLARDVVGWNRLACDTNAAIAAVSDGKPLMEALPRGGRVLRPSTLVAIDYASRQNDLPRTLASISRMQRQELETLLGMLPATLTPALVLVLAAAVAFCAYAVLTPLLSTIDVLS